MLIIDLDQPAEKRWAPLGPRAASARALLDVYEKDLGSTVQSLRGTLLELARSVLPSETFAELEGVSKTVDAPLARVVLGNLYYDLIKAGLGCSAFAIDTPQGPLHARNLDWWTAGGLLRNERSASIAAATGKPATSSSAGRASSAPSQEWLQAASPSP